MQGYDPSAACAAILRGIKRREYKEIENELEGIIREFIELDLRYMQENDIVNADGEAGENEYDDDEAIEYIYDGWLDKHPERDDDDLLIAQLLDEYMEGQYKYLCSIGMA